LQIHFVGLVNLDLQRAMAEEFDEFPLMMRQFFQGIFDRQLCHRAPKE
jgi:hypothetical protein